MAKKPYIRIIGLTMVILLMGLFSPLYLPSGPVSAEDPVSNFDLGVTLLNPPAELATGSKAALTAVVSNYGTEKSPKASASFYIGEQLLTTKSISSIKPDNSKTLKIKMTIPGNIAEEKASLRVVITTALPEANLDNNSVKQSVNIVKPDLTINSVTAKKEIIPGKSASLSLEIANLYMARASSFNIQAYRNDSDVVMAVKKVSRLDLGTKTISLSVKIPKDFKKDGEYIRLVIDADDTVLEENEKNNVFNFNRENVRPTVITYEPEVNAVDVAQDANLVLTFIETVSAVSGKNITIKKAADNTAVAVIAADGPQVTVDGAVVTVNPDIDLDYSTAYYVQVEPGAFKSSFNADYSGIEDTSTWCFTTIKSTQATPTFSPSAGAVVFGTRLQIISNGAEHIYYTTDESNPATAVGGSTLEYDDTNRPVIDKAMTVKAIATRTNYNDSAIGSV
ncbi:MAG: CARDB domain-containing protein, partial [Chitinophagales bacterium]